MSDSLGFNAPAAARPAAPAPDAADPRRFPYLSGLNPAQREAVLTLDGPVLVLAGAGTGKTRTLTTRLAHILATGQARPWEILAVTFTNRAAAEMRERVAALIGRPVEGWWLGTFHALSARILRSHAEVVGLRPNFTILDADDQLRLMKQLLDAESVDTQRWPARVLLTVVQRWKDRGLTPDKVTAAEAGDLANGRAVALYRMYQQRLATLNAADFGDLLLHCLTLFQRDAEVLQRYRRQFRFLLVDEYQDTNVAQYLWLRLLAPTPEGGVGNICCVGDDDQSIYGWRGAEVGNILRFDQDFPGAKVIRLEQNYRSTPHILACASALIAHNEGRLGKTLWTQADQGAPVTVRGVWDGEAEARFVGEEVEALQRRGETLDEIAVLVRAGYQTREFEERFMTLGLPFRVIGGPRFYERQEIRDALAYLRVIAQPDDGLAFERIVNVPRRGIGVATLRVLHGLARAESISLVEAAGRLIGTDELKPAARKALSRLIEDFARWRALKDRVPHPELAETVLDESGYTGMWQADRSPEAPGRLDNLKELVRAMADFESLDGFLEHVALVMENDQSATGERVSIMTLHGAKGLEFDSVFLPGWEEGLFPNQRSLDELGNVGLEEERRLAHVGITRARQRVYISFAANRRIYNQWQTSLPSRFIDELPEDHIQRDSELGLYGGAGADAGPGMSSGQSSGMGFGGSTAASEWAARRRNRQAPPLLEATASAVDDDPAGARFQVGERVFHQKFGYGAIQAVEGSKLLIAFEKAGTKKVLDSFVERP